MKKIISLLVVCVMLCSMSIMASAATFTISSLDLTTEDYNAEDGYYEVPVYIDELWIENSDLENQVAKAGNGWKLEVSFPADKLAVHEWIANDGSVQYASYDSKRKKWTKADMQVSSQQSSEATGLLNIAGGTTAGGIMPNSLNDGDFCYVLLKPVDGATGVADVNIKLVVSDTTAVEYTAIATSQINLGGAEEPEVPAEKPETTVVKTFPKRFYADNALTTVGVILEGKDYDNATEVKAGIKTQRDEVNVNTYAPGAIASATDEDKSYIMVTLGEITETTVFQPTTPTWAFVEIDGNLIEGEKVTENVTSADDAGAGEDYKD